MAKEKLELFLGIETAVIQPIFSHKLAVSDNMKKKTRRT
jgi:hypothetical protein